MRNAIKFIIAIIIAGLLMILFRCVAFTIYIVPKTGIKHGSSMATVCW